MSPQGGGRYAMQQPFGAGGGFNASAYGVVLGEYDLSNTSKITASGGNVSAVAPTSGTWGSMVEPTGASQPKTGTRSQNAKNVLDFDGIDDYLYLATVGGNQPVTVAVVAASDNVDSALHQLVGYHPTLYVESDVWKFSSPTVVASTVIEDPAFHVLVGIFNGASSELWIDGAKVLGPVNVGTSPIGDYYIGSGITQVWDGPIGHVITYNGVVADPAGLSNALMTLWGIVPFSPSSVSGLLGWWDPSVNGSLTQSAGKVSQANGIGGTAYNIGQATGAMQPGLTTLGGRQAFNFDGNDDNLTHPTMPIATPCTIFCVVNSAGGGQGDYHRPFNALGTNGIIDYSLSVAHQYQAASAVNSGLAVGNTATPAVLSILFNGAGSGMWKNGVAGTTGNPGTYSGAGFALGGDGTTFGWLAGIGETIIYNRALTTTERQNVENYLRAKWGAP